MEPLKNTKRPEDGGKIESIDGGVRLIVQELKLYAKTDEEKYRNILYKPYYLGLIDGEKRILKFLEVILSRQEY